MNETTDPSPAGRDVLQRLAEIEASAARTADVLTANIRSVEALVGRYYDVIHRLVALERALAQRDASHD